MLRGVLSTSIAGVLSSTIAATFSGVLSATPPVAGNVNIDDLSFRIIYFTTTIIPCLRIRRLWLVSSYEAQQGWFL